MKKTLVIISLLLLAVMTRAQELELNEQGAYERQDVIHVDGVTAAQLYDRAMMALSDWAGADGKAKVGVDYQNQETHTLIYKGTFYLGYNPQILNGWHRYGNFTLRVRCKDGRAQLTLSVPTITGIYDKDGTTQVVSLKDVLDAKDKVKKKKLERLEKLIADLKDNADNIFAAMSAKLKNGSDDDDF